MKKRKLKWHASCWSGPISDEAMFIASGGAFDQEDLEKLVGFLVSRAITAGCENFRILVNDL